MKAEEILKSRWLDILFEHRNKEYGAYTLRKNYDQRLVKAVVATLVFSFGVFLLLQNIKTKSSANPLFYSEEYLLADPPPVQPPKKILPVKQAVPVKSISYVVPVFTKKPVAPQVTSPDDDPLAAITGTNNPVGPPVTTITQPVAPITPAAPVTQPDPQPAPIVNDAPVTHAEQMPVYPGGRDKMIAFLQQQLQDYVTEEGMVKRAVVRFVIEKDGTLTAIEITTGEDGDFNKKVVHTIQKMPKWKPGAQNGQTVKVLYELPIQLLPQESEISV